jgi:alkylation response protein AidB-like acyl-CoA dehydrogenase
VVYQLDHLSKADGNRILGGTTALLKAHASLTLELVAREAVQVLGGIGHTRGGVGERVERIQRDVKGVAIVRFVSFLPLLLMRCYSGA